MEQECGSAAVRKKSEWTPLAHDWRALASAISVARQKCVLPLLASNDAKHNVPNTKASDVLGCECRYSCPAPQVTYGTSVRAATHAPKCVQWVVHQAVAGPLPRCARTWDGAMHTD